MTCLRCGHSLTTWWTYLVHFCGDCAPSVLPPAPFMTDMGDGKMRRAGRWSVFPHQWFYRHDPRYNPALRTRWRKFAGPTGPGTKPAWW